MSRMLEAIDAVRSLRAIADARRAGVAAGTWPAHSMGDWQDMAERAAARAADGFGLSPLERHALELFPVPER